MAEQKNSTETKEKLVKVLVPKTRKDEDDLRLWINDDSWLIKKGVYVEVPERVAKALERRQAKFDKILNSAPTKNEN
jgi:hypothetical protein